MNILVIGLGSMGKRRIRLLREMFPEFHVYGADSREDRRNEVAELYDIECAVSTGEARQRYRIEVAFVCTSPLSHSAIIGECLDNGWDVFTELNLVSDGYERNIELAKAKGRTLFLSSTFLYRDEIQYIKKKVVSDHKWNYIYHIGQYLPDWHPWENYKDFFVKDVRTNGCREILAIELPWIVDSFGEVRDYNVFSDKMTSLAVDYKDNYLIQLAHENGNKGILVVDVVSPVAVRRLEVYREHEYIRWSGTPDSLMEYNKIQDRLNPVILGGEGEHRDGYRAFVVEDAYRSEILEFIDTIHSGKELRYGFEQDLKILRLADALEAGAKWV